MQFRKVTAVLVVKEVEPCVEFWTQRLGFEVTVSVPEGQRTGFVILAHEEVELMYQSEASMAKDVPAILEQSGRSALYLEVADLDAVERRLAGVAQVVPRRKTFYGADEIIVRDPAGNTILFAQPAG